jgi:hypothetical protein
MAQYFGQIPFSPEKRVDCFFNLKSLYLQLPLVHWNALNIVSIKADKLTEVLGRQA